MSSIPPLHLAASRGDLIKVQELVRKGAVLETKSDEGLTPVMHSIHNNHKDVASYLVKQMTGKDLAVEDIFGYNVLHYLARDGRPWLQLMKIVCEKCPEAIQKVNYKGRQPIDVAREMLDDDPRQSEYREIIQCLETLAQYQVKKGIAEKSIQTCNITITFIGNNGSGKTCLRKQLSREEFPIDGPGSTNLVEFLANYLDWDPLTGTRQKLGEGGGEETGVERLRRIFKRYNAQQTSNTLGTGQNESATESSEDSQLQDQRRDVSPIPDMDVDHSQQELVGDILHQYDDDTYWFDTEMDDNVPYDDESEENEYEYENKELDNPKEKESDTIKGFITLYDFGGEIIFYNTHHCFMSGDMVFILVFNVAMCIDSVKGEKEIKSIESWLCSVGTYAVDDSDTQKGIPPILLVGSHLDQVPGTAESICDRNPLEESVCDRYPLEESVCDRYPLDESVCDHSSLEESLCDRYPPEESVCDRYPLEESVCDCYPLEESVYDRYPLEESVCDRYPLDKRLCDRYPF